MVAGARGGRRRRWRRCWPPGVACVVCVAPRGRDGAQGCGEGARGWLWPWGSSSAATAAFGRVRERKQRRETRERERARGSRGSGRHRGDDARRRGGQATQAGSLVAWRARARAPCPSSAYWHEEEGDREEEVGWAAGGAGPGKWPRWASSLSLFSCFSFLFFSVLF